MGPRMALHAQPSAGASGVMVKDGEREVVKDGEKGFCCWGAAQGVEVRGVLTHMPGPRGRRGNAGPACLPRGRRLEEDRKYRWRSKKERQPVRKVQISQMTAISALLPHTSPETLLNLF